MIVVEHPEDLPPDDRPAFLAIGVFDGVHLGHQRLLRALTSRAREAGARSLAMTFHPHPGAVLDPANAPALLTPLDERERLIAAQGVEALVVLPFTAELAHVPAEEFAAGWLAGRIRPASVFVGYNFTFGHRGRGTPDVLARLGAELGFSVEVIPPVRIDGRAVSSTDIRRAVREGRLAAAARALGRPYSLAGKVVPGDGRGRALGLPTANLAVPDGLCWPAAGVYAVQVDVGEGRLHPGVANIGWRPTFGGRPGEGREVLEVHLFDFSGNLYGRALRVAFVARLREERRFPSAAALRAQVAEDAAAARRLLAAREGAGAPAR